MKFFMLKNPFNIVLMIAVACSLTLTINTEGKAELDCNGLPGQTVGLFCSDETQSLEGYTLFKPLRGRGVYLIDNNGNKVKDWIEPDGIRGVTMLITKEGTLIRNLCASARGCGGDGAIIREYDWDNNVIWQYRHDGAHHDIVRLPGGNLLITVLQPDRTESILEIKPDYKNWNPYISTLQHGEGGKIVWEWYVRDHVVPIGQDPAGYPELFDVRDYRSLNALDYNRERNEILMSFNQKDEIIVISHKSTTKGAAGSKGNILYRWGNPFNYEMGEEGENVLDFQHSTKWIQQHGYGYKFPDDNSVGLNNILIFNNRFNKVDEIIPPIQGNKYYMEDEIFGPSEPIWSFIWGESFGLQSSVQRLPNGNSLLAFSDTMTFEEINMDGETVWKFISPFCTDNPVGYPTATPHDFQRNYDDPGCLELGFDVSTTLHFNVKRYSPDFEGFKDKEFIEPALPLVPLQ